MIIIITRFSSISECETTCASKLTSKFSPKNPLCLKTAVEGRRQCKGMFARFTFNADVGRCEEFVYSGQFDYYSRYGRN